MCSDAPLWRRLDRNLEGYEDSHLQTEEKKEFATVNGKSIEEVVAETYTYPYGSEKPITLCEAFIRKFMGTRKT